MASWPSLREVRALLRLAPDTGEDAVIDAARLAAIGYGISRLGRRYPADTDELPAEAHEAALLHAARLYRRRDSVDGTIGWGDLGIVRVGRGDPDVAALYDSVGPWVFG